MLNEKIIFKTFLAMTFLSQPVNAALISNTDITPSTTLPESSSFPINEIADGISSDNPFNGFVSNSASGTIQLDLNNGDYDLTGFILYNDINVFQEGINQFKLEFFNSLGQSTGFSTDFFALDNTLSAQTFSISQSNVSRVDLIVLSSHFGATHRIEIREVEFEGVTSVPVPAAIWLFGSGLLGLVGVARRKKLGSRI